MFLPLTERAGFEPATDPCNSKDLQQSIALNQQIGGENQGETDPRYHLDMNPTTKGS